MFSRHRFSKAVIKCCVYRYLRYSLSYRDLEELISERGLSIDHTSIHRWVLKFTVLLEPIVRRKKHSVGGSWRMDETYIGSVCIKVRKPPQRI